MKLLIATGLYPPEIGGPATYAKLFEERLPTYGIETVVLPFSTVRHLPPLIRHAVYAYKVWKLSRGVALVLVQDTVSTGFPVALASLFSGRPYVLRVPGDYAWEQGVQRFGVKVSLDDFQRRSSKPAIWILRALQNFVVRRAAKVVTPSEYLANIVRGWVPEKTIDVIYNGVELVQVRLAQEGHENIRQANLIVTSGRLVPWKGFDALIDVVAGHSDWRLDIYGEGPEGLSLQDRIWEMHAEERICLRGSVSHEELRNAFAKATVFVLNSRYEGLSHTLVEAMAAGVPIVATDVGGNPEVVRNGVHGFLVPPGATRILDEKLEELLKDAALREKMGNAARERAKDFSIKRTVEKTAMLLRKAV